MNTMKRILIFSLLLLFVLSLQTQKLTTFSDGYIAEDVVREMQ